MSSTLSLLDSLRRLLDVLHKGGYQNIQQEGTHIVLDLNNVDILRLETCLYTAEVPYDLLVTTETNGYMVSLYSMLEYRSSVIVTNLPLRVAHRAYRQRHDITDINRLESSLKDLSLTPKDVQQVDSDCIMYRILSADISTSLCRSRLNTPGVEIEEGINNRPYIRILNTDT